MKELKTTDKNLVAVAIGQEGEKWYVQTTDFEPDVYLSEAIEENLESKDHAMAIANLYVEKYGLKLIDWSITPKKPEQTETEKDKQMRTALIDIWDLLPKVPGCEAKQKIERIAGKIIYSDN